MARLWSGNDLRLERQRAGVAMDAVAWLLGVTFIEIVHDIEGSMIVSPQVSDDYLAAVELLRPTSELLRRHYGPYVEDPEEEQHRLYGRREDRPRKPQRTRT